MSTHWPRAARTIVCKDARCGAIGSDYLAVDLQLDSGDPITAGHERIHDPAKVFVGISACVEFYPVRSSAIVASWASRSLMATSVDLPRREIDGSQRLNKAQWSRLVREINRPYDIDPLRRLSNAGLLKSTRRTAVRSTR